MSPSNGQDSTPAPTAHSSPRPLEAFQAIGSAGRHLPPPAWGRPLSAGPIHVPGTAAMTGGTVPRDTRR